MIKSSLMLLNCIFIFCIPLGYAVEKPTETETTKNTLLDYLTDANGKYIGPTVEDQVLTMDTDHNGFADVFEVRAYLQNKHGKDYQKALLDKMVRTADRHSCGTSITNDLTQNVYSGK